MARVLRSLKQLSLCSTIRVLRNLSGAGSRALLDVKDLGKKCMSSPVSVVPDLWMHGSREYSSSNNTTFDSVGFTTILVQDGLDIQELPVIVRRTNDFFIIYKNVGELSTRCLHTSQNGDEHDEKGPKEAEKTESHPNQTENEIKDLKEGDKTLSESSEIKAGFDRSSSTKDILKLLEIIPYDEVTPEVAVHVLRRINELEREIKFQNHFESLKSDESLSTFVHSAIIQRLEDLICSSDDAQVLIQGLKLFSDYLLNEQHKLDCHRKICDKCLVQITDGRFKVKDICEIIKLLHSMNDQAKIDQTWVGIVEKVGEIDVDSLMEVVRILSVLKQSQKIVLNVIEKRVADLWWQLKADHVIDILGMLLQCRHTAYLCMAELAKWTNLNIHALSETELMNIVKHFNMLSYTNQPIQRALERYMRICGQKIQDPDLVGVIMSHCRKFNIRLENILQPAAEFFTHRAEELSPMQIDAIVRPFGIVNYDPPHGFEFFKVLETALFMKFTEFRPDDFIELMLSLVYIKRYPLNFANRIFSPYFWDRYYSLKDPREMKYAQSRLSLLDASLFLECPGYRGPRVPQDRASPVPSLRHPRVLQARNILMEHLLELFGSHKFTRDVKVNTLYIVDFVIHPYSKNPVLNYAAAKIDAKLMTAVIIHHRVHYCWGTEVLIGSEAMRVRHLGLLGYKVAHLDLETVYKLKVHSVQLREYLVSQLDAAK